MSGNRDSFRRGIGARIRGRRIQLGLRQWKLADACGFDQNMVSHYERGITQPTAMSLVILCRELSVSADWLLGIERDQ